MNSLRARLKMMKNEEEQKAVDAITKEDFAPSYLREYYCRIKGRGVITRTLISKGKFITFFKSKICKRVENSTDDFIFQVNVDGQVFYLDASMEDGSFGRLFNDNPRTPNMIVRKICVDGFPIACFFAKENIEAGQCLEYDYGGEESTYHWRKHLHLCDSECLKNVRVPKASHIMTSTHPEPLDNQVPPAASNDVTKELLRKVNANSKNIKKLSNSIRSLKNVVLGDRQESNKKFNQLLKVFSRQLKNLEKPIFPCSPNQLDLRIANRDEENQNCEIGESNVRKPPVQSSWEDTGKSLPDGSDDIIELRPQQDIELVLTQPTENNQIFQSKLGDSSSLYKDTQASSFKKRKRNITEKSAEGKLGDSSSLYKDTQASSFKKRKRNITEKSAEAQNPNLNNGTEDPVLSALMSSMESEEIILLYNADEDLQFVAVKMITQKNKIPKWSCLPELQTLTRLFLTFREKMSWKTRLEVHEIKFQDIYRLKLKETYCLPVLKEVITNSTTDYDIRTGYGQLFLDAGNYLLEKLKTLGMNDRVETITKFLKALDVLMKHHFYSDALLEILMVERCLNYVEHCTKEKCYNDVEKYVKEALEEYVEGYSPEKVDYGRLRSLLVTRLTFLNGREMSEPTLLTLDDYRLAKKGVFNSRLKKTLSQVDSEHTLKGYKLAFINKRRGNALAILIPNHCLTALDILTCPQVRKMANISKKNRYCFASSKGDGRWQTNVNQDIDFVMRLANSADYHTAREIRDFVSKMFTYVMTQEAENIENEDKDLEFDAGRDVENGENCVDPDKQSKNTESASSESSSKGAAVEEDREETIPTLELA